MKIIAFIILIILLFRKSNEEFNLIKRIESAVKFLLSQLENISSNYFESFTFKYPKYTIDFSNFRIVSPIVDNIIIDETFSNSSIYKFNNITFGIIYDLTIHFNDCNYIKKDNYLDSTFSSLYFKYDSKNDFLKFDSFGDLNLNKIKTNFYFETLDFFKNLKKINFVYVKRIKKEYIQK